MDLNPQQFRTAVQAAFTAVQARYAASMASTETVYERIATTVPSTTGANLYPVLLSRKRMKKWVGPKTIEQLGMGSFTVVNDDFEVTVEIDRNDIDDDMLGLVSVQAQEAGNAAKVWPDQLIVPLMSRGFTTLGHDGQYFFDTDHVQGDGAGNMVSVSNKGTKALSVDSLAAAKASFGAARTQMRRFRDLDGNKLGIRPSLLVVPPALEDVATALMTVDRLEDGKVNIYKGAATVVVVDDLETDTEWYLLDTTKPLGAFIFQLRKAPVMVSQTDLTSDRVFMTKKFLFGAEARGAGAYGMWQCAYGSTGVTP